MKFHFIISRRIIKKKFETVFSPGISNKQSLDMTTSTEDQSAHSEAELVATSPSEGDDCFIIRTCIGTGCALNNHRKQFRIKRNATNASDKKCQQCVIFEAALNKVLVIEAYLLEQLQNPTDDISLLLRDLSILMTESRYNPITKHRYYAVALTIPRLRQILNETAFDPKQPKYRNCSRNALNLLAATFGIVLKGKIFNNPFPALTLSAADNMWGRDINADKDRDTWEQLTWFITNFSITKRKQQLEKIDKPHTSLDPAALHILTRAEKLQQLAANPSSITTAMPRRIMNTWDSNILKTKSKKDTIQTTLNILHESNEKLLQDIHHLSAKRRIRETTNRAPSQRKPLSELTNKASVNTPNPFTLKTRKVPTPNQDSIQPPLARQLFLEQEAQGVVLSSDDDEPIHPHIRAMTNVYHLSPSDLNSISVKMTDMRGRCALAVCDMLNFEHDVSNLSCANTTIYSLLCQGHFSRVKRLIHPPAGNDDTSWITPPKRRASARSLSLLIPCLDETIAHWFLIAIFTLNTGKKRVLIFAQKFSKKKKT